MLRLINQPKAVQVLVNTRPPRLLRLKNRPNPGANPGANAGATPGQYKAVEINNPTQGCANSGQCRDFKDFKAFNDFMDAKLSDCELIVFFSF